MGIVNVPMTYPPEPVNGYLISGLDTPHEGCEFMYPRELKEELAAQGIDYRIDIQHLGNMRTDRVRDRTLQSLREIEAARTAAMKYLAGKGPSDFRMIVYTATDQVQHHFWHYHDPMHAKHDAAGAKRYANAIRDIYIHVDSLLDDLLKQVGDETVVIVMSDHGFGPTSNVRLRLNQALADAGLLSFRKAGPVRRAFRRAAGLFDRMLRSTLSDGAKHFLAGKFPKLRVAFERADEPTVDWARTIAHVNEAYRSSPAVWIDRGNSDKDKPGSNSDERERALLAAEQKLKELVDPQTGQPVISRVFRARDLYHGPFVDKAPDLFPSWWIDGFLTEQSEPDNPATPIVERSTAPLNEGIEFAGSHRLDGVFMIAGGPVRPGHAFSGAKIIDVAPTVLYLMGLPIPADMDGRPLLDAFDPDFVAEHPPVFEQSGEPSDSADAGSVANEAEFTDAEAELIAQRLRALGYIK